MEIHHASSNLEELCKMCLSHCKLSQQQW